MSPPQLDGCSSSLYFWVSTSLWIWFIFLQISMFGVGHADAWPTRGNSVRGVETVRARNEDPVFLDRIGTTVTTTVTTTETVLVTVPPPGASPEPPLEKGGPFPSPVNIAFATLGAVAGFTVLIFFILKVYARWCYRIREDREQIWPPVDAPQEEIFQLVELIRVGMINAHGAPLHVINWVVNGVNAPWPPPGGIESLRRRTRRRRRRIGSGSGNRDGSGRNSNRARDEQHIDMPRRMRRRRRPASITLVDPLPVYVQNAEHDPNHYPVTEIPDEFPPPPPRTPSITCSGSNMVTSAADPALVSFNDDESEAGFRRTLSRSVSREDHELVIMGLIPRPPPTAVLAPLRSPTLRLVSSYGTLRAHGLPSIDSHGENPTC
ncbi:hypothetical protein BDZ91DRAFT_547859 [Kalaharituber pfeilii]|nr:hypothetical protein BDZ91DRAFT_547859 [Kalaharituber pfeilii]